MDDEYLTAAEAHELSVDSECTMNKIYIFIERAAKENRCRLCYDFVDTEPSVIRRVLGNLRSNGYKVAPVEDADTSFYMIQW